MQIARIIIVLAVGALCAGCNEQSSGPTEARTPTFSAAGGRDSSQHFMLRIDGQTAWAGWLDQGRVDSNGYAGAPYGFLSTQQVGPDQMWLSWEVGECQGYYCAVTSLGSGYVAAGAISGAGSNRLTLDVAPADYPGLYLYGAPPARIKVTWIANNDREQHTTGTLEERIFRWTTKTTGTTHSRSADVSGFIGDVPVLTASATAMTATGHNLYMEINRN
jgi:hypothetical protein